MASGELSPVGANDIAPPNWTPHVGPHGEAEQPLTTTQLELLDDVLREAERFTGLRFSVYLGDLGRNTAASAEGPFAGLGADAPPAGLLAVSPGQRVVEVGSGGEA